MIIQLGKGKLSIKQRLTPEPLHKVHIQYVFELNTNHLTPKLYLGKHTFKGNRIDANVEEALRNTKGSVPIRIKVELVNADDIPIRTYVGEIPCHKYCLFGDKPTRPHFERRIRELELEVEKLQNEGEVI